MTTLVSGGLEERRGESVSSDDHGPLVLSPDMLQERVKLVDVADLTQWDASPFDGDVGAAHTFMGTFGQLSLPVVVDGEVVYGQEFVAAEVMGAQFNGQVAVLDVSDLDWPREKVVAAVLGLHRLEALTQVDNEQLASLLVDIRQADEQWLQGAGWDGEDLDTLLDDIERDREQNRLADGVDPDDIPDDAPAITKAGDVWIIGEHRVMCGDATSTADVAALIGNAQVDALVTDPPYGINLDAVNGLHGAGSTRAALAGRPGKTYRPIIGDDGPFNAAPVADRFDAVAEQFWFGADYYRRTLPAPDSDGSWLVWDKRTEETDTVIGAGFELIWSRQRHNRDLLRFYWCGVFGDKEARDRVHPTQKPTKLIAEILNRWVAAGGVVVDAYAGSGSILIAAHQTGRTALLMELDPRYVDVICKRAQQATGIKPVLEATGEVHDFTAEADG